MVASTPLSSPNRPGEASGPPLGELKVDDTAGGADGDTDVGAIKDVDVLVAEDSCLLGWLEAAVFFGRSPLTGCEFPFAAVVDSASGCVAGARTGGGAAGVVSADSFLF